MKKKTLFEDKRELLFIGGPLDGELIYPGNHETITIQYTTNRGCVQWTMDAITPWISSPDNEVKEIKYVKGKLEIGNEYRGMTVFEFMRPFSEYLFPEDVIKKLFEGYRNGA